LKLALVLLVCACAVDDPLGTDRSGCAQSPCNPTDRQAYCAGKGPPILVGDGTGATDICSGHIAQTTFRFAVCTCDDYVTSFALQTDSFSAAAGYTPGGRGGSVGTNKTLQANGDVTLGGSLWAAGTDVRAANLSVAGELRDQGALDSGGAVRVDRDAFVGGNIDVVDLTVAGTLTQPSTSTLTIHGTNNAPTIANAAVTVTPPCDCTNLVNIAGYVDAHQFANHNADINLDPHLLENSTAASPLMLPCGRFYLTRINGDSLTIVAGGRTALFVGQDVTLMRDLTIQLAPGAELDLFIHDTLNVSGTVTVGSRDQPNRARVYIGGASSIQLGGSGTFGGNLYAPASILQASGNFEVFGSLFVRSVSASGQLIVHYDTDVLTAGDQCPTGTPTSCRTCVDCGNQACIDGACGQCRTSADCCPPLLCAGGHCSPQVP
jgi:hypothetical protein